MPAVSVSAQAARQDEGIPASAPATDAGADPRAQTHRVEQDGPEAELLVQLGDIDNLGFGWPKGFDPFTGRSTPPHRFPWQPGDDDPPGTDRIMVISGWKSAGARKDGYTWETSRPDNRPQPLVMTFDLGDVVATSAALQLFVDDFQAPVWRNRYTVRLDDREAPDMAAALNQLNQTGPIGKLVTLQLLPEYLPLLADGRLSIAIDDPDSDAGDGFAIDFARLLINPKAWKYTGTIRGIAVLADDGAPLADVLVSAGNVRQVATDNDGRFELTQVPAGLVITTGSHPDYLPDSEAADLVAGATADFVLELAPAPKTSDALADRLEAEGRIDLYGLYFDTDQATLKPESEGTLQQVRGLLTSRPGLRVVIAGHTDAEGSDTHNLALSERRAAAVVSWLTSNGIDAARMQSEGLGELQPVADNGSVEGRALNRRVEIRDAGP